MGLLTKSYYVTISVQHCSKQYDIINKTKHILFGFI